MSMIKLYFWDHLKRASMQISSNFGNLLKILLGFLDFLCYSLFSCFNTAGVGGWLGAGSSKGFSVQCQPWQTHIKTISLN